MVERVPIDSITEAQFAERYLRPNRPVLLTGIETLAETEWVTAGGTPDIEYFATVFGDSSVPVASPDGSRCTMTVSEYASWWRGSRAGPPQYLKDWHFAAQHPTYGAYLTPPHVADDWLNEHWFETSRIGKSYNPYGPCDGEGDHRFVYLGPAGSRTKLHADVLFSYSWSLNVCGVKRWRLVPAAHRGLVADAYTAPRAPDLASLPAALEVAITVEQNPWELLFVPAAWYHEVENVTDCLSINHNWIHRHGARWPLVRLSECAAAIRASLPADDADDAELVGSLLRRRVGYDLGELQQLYEGIAARRGGDDAAVARTLAGEVAALLAEGDDDAGDDVEPPSKRKRGS